MITKKYIPGSDGMDCYAFVSLLCTSLYGNALTGQPSSLSLKTDYISQIGQTLSNAKGTLNQSSLKNLFSNAMVGDIVQMDYTRYKPKTLDDGTTWDSRHTMMVYSVSSTGVVFYHAGSSSIYFGRSSGNEPLWGKDSLTNYDCITWEELMYCLRSSDDGISLYRSKIVTTDTTCAHKFTYACETAHPHREYRKCSLCEILEYTGGQITVGSCSECKTHTHTFGVSYEAAHPHKEYRKCTSCEYWEYTGGQRLVSSCTTCYPTHTYGSTNPDDYVYPDRSLVYTSPTMKGEDVAWVQSVLYQLGYAIDVDGSYGKNSVATIERFQADYGLTVDGHCGPATRAKLLELWENKKHVHAYTQTYHEAAHPHRVYLACSCGATSYSGGIYESWQDAYESAHPHKNYRKCYCGYTEYKGTNHESWLGTSYEADHPHRVYRTCSCGYWEYTGANETVSACNYCINAAFSNRISKENHIYDLYTIHTTWDKARAFCEEKGGHLVTVTAQWEVDAVKELMDDRICWAGGYRTALFNFQWVTYEPFSFTNWLEGEPNNAGGEEYYLGIYPDGGWNDFHISNQYVGGFICEYDPITISFNANGGKGAPLSIVKSRDVAVNLPNSAPTRNGYKFLGWSTDSNAVTGSYWCNASYAGNEDVTLYAVWKEEPFDQKYDYDKALFYYSYKADGVDTERGIASMVVYTSNYGSNTKTDMYGWEVAIDSTGQVLSKTYGVGNKTIPQRGFVVSEHAFQDNGFISKYIEVGNYIYLDSLTEKVYVFSTLEKMEAFLKCKDRHSGEEVVKNQVDATYESSGYTGDVCCSVCNELLYRGKYTEILTRKEGVTEEGIAYVRDLAPDGSREICTITGYTGDAVSIEIPAEIEGVPVALITSSAFQNMKQLTSVTIPNGITAIGSFAFYGCEGLTEVVIPESVETIGRYAFWNRNKLKSATLQNPEVVLGELAFSEDTKVIYEKPIDQTVPHLKIDPSNTNLAILNAVGFKATRVYWGYAGEEKSFARNWNDFSVAVPSAIRISDYAPTEGEVYAMEKTGYYLFWIQYTDAAGKTQSICQTVYAAGVLDENYGKPYLQLTEDGKVAVMDLNGTTVQKMYWGYIGKSDYKYSTWNEFKSRIGDTYLPDYGVKSGEGYVLNRVGYYRFVIVYLDAQGIRQERYFTINASTPAVAPFVDNSVLSNSATFVNNEGYASKVYCGYIGTKNTKYVDFNTFKATATDFTTDFGTPAGKSFKLNKAGYWRFVINYTVHGATKDAVVTVYVKAADLALGTPKVTQSGTDITLDYNGAAVSKMYVGYMGNAPVEVDCWADYSALRQSNTTYYGPKNATTVSLGKSAGYYTVVVAYNNGGADQLAFYTFQI